MVTNYLLCNAYKNDITIIGVGPHPRPLDKTIRYVFFDFVYDNLLCFCVYRDWNCWGFYKTSLHLCREVCAFFPTIIFLVNTGSLVLLYFNTFTLLAKQSQVYIL